MGKLDQKEFQRKIGRIEELIRAIDQSTSPNTQATARELVQALMDLHSTGLEHLLNLVYESDLSGQALIDELARDERVGNLLLLHDLHPLDLEARVMLALEKVRPYMRSHGGNVELLDITPQGVVKLRLEGSCHSCPSSRVTLKYAVEEAISAIAPDVTGVEAEGAAERQPLPPPGFIPMTQLIGSSPHNGNGNGHGWVDVEGLSSLKEGAVRMLDVSGLPVLFCRVAETFYAYGNTCPKCGQLLGQARLAGKDLICTQCGHHYDVMRAGRDMDEPSLYLAPFPLLAEGSQVKIALPA